MMNLEKAEKLPNAVFEKLPDSEPIAPESAATNSAQTSTSGANVLDIGVKAENSPFLNSADNASARPLSQPAPASPMFGGSTGTSAKLGDSLSGKTATKILDFIFPALVAYLVEMLGYRFDKRMIELTPDEEKVIASAMQDYLNTVQVSFNNPLYTLLFVIGGVYTGKAIEVLPRLQKAPKQSANTAQGQTPRGVRVANVTVIESLISRTAKARKKGRNDAIAFLKKEGEILEVEKGVYKLA